ncbi:MAG: HPr-rel-A system PqqD family peptide chaperone [Burkholderiaceae bacterium]|jgi:PqqD family protein of HPr-rel-A system|nr:HPr-rel-A system PqqD family peptide chaperone [Burkholderiaceae bacterium]
MSPLAGGATRWRVPSDAPFAWAHSDSGHVLYHRPSGQTHFLNDGAALLLRECLLDPRDALEAAHALANLQGASPDPQFLRHVEELLSHLERVGLVEPVAV